MEWSVLRLSDGLECHLTCLTVFITASEYFAKRFEGSGYEGTFQNYFSTSFTIANLVCFAMLLWKQSKSTAFYVDLVSSVVVNVIVFGVMAITVETDVGGSEYFWCTLVMLVVTGVSTSFFQVSVFAEASRFPSEYMQAVMSGQGVAGVAVAVSSILSALAGSTNSPPDEAAIARSAFLYFMTALLITVAALIGRFVVARQPFYLRHITFETVPASASDVSSEDDVESSSQLFATESLSVSRVFCKSAGLIFAVGYVFFITLALFPSITALIKSVHQIEVPLRSMTGRNRFFDDDIFVAFHFLLFNVGDWVGRTMPIIQAFRTFDTRALTFMSLARTIFVPAFLICNVVVPDDRKLSVWVNSDIAYFIIVWLFAVTNGWIGSLTMMAAPQQTFLKSAAEKSLIGSLMSFFLVLGLAIGGAASFILRAMV
ncbi:nucleoside transporter-domain-containing protein [Phycomyces blakesleeanus]|uniref:Nucleoside transporter-domain-containing protein n=1 Tax=Phycomyces blakesleeanus TaxID=4837 RepID=A0ABR3ALL8_PHYBL